MDVLKGVPNIRVINSKYDCQIDYVQSFDEDEDRLILRCAEYMQCFERGFICDMDCRFDIYDTELGKITGESKYVVKDLLLVHIRKRTDVDSYIPQFEYVFYK